jgi:hypothetical protein
MGAAHWLERDTLTNTNISSATLAGTYTASADDMWVACRLYAQGLAGGGDYIYYLTITPTGLSEGEMYKTTQTLGATTYQLGAQSIPIFMDTGDVLKAYIDGLAGDTTTPDVYVDWFEDNCWESESRTLTQAAASVVTTVSGSAITVTRGDTLSATLTGLSANTGYVSIDFSVKTAKTDDDSVALIRIRKNASGLTDGLLYINCASADTAANGSITVNSSTSITIALAAVETAKLVQPGGWYDVQYIFAASVLTATAGTCVIADDVTQAVA